MNEVNESTYNSDRSWFLLIAVLSFLNIILIPLTNRTLQFSAFVPMIAVTYGMYYLEGASKWIAIYGFGLGTTILFFFSWIFSRKNHIWAYVGALMYIADTAVMIYYISTIGYNTIWLLDIAVHFIILFFLVRCCYTGRKEYLQQEKEKQYYSDTQQMEYSLDDELEEIEEDDKQ